MINILRQILRTGVVTQKVALDLDEGELIEVRTQLQAEIKKLFHGSLTIRQVDAGSCNACELEIHAVNNSFYNCEGYGVHFTASPRFADMLLVTGPVSRNMEIALRRTYAATPSPKLVVAMGRCACDGGVFGQSYASAGAISNIIPVDVYIPGCPPTPIAILKGILAAVRIDK